MTERPPRSLTPRSPGFFREVWIRVRLVLRLMADRRVPVLLKLLPLGSFVYLVFPDLLPGPIDDTLVIGLGAYLFVELCPPAVVKEHMDALTSVIDGEWHEIPDKKPRSGGDTPQ